MQDCPCFPSDEQFGESKSKLWIVYSCLYSSTSNGKENNGRMLYVYILCKIHDDDDVHAVTLSLFSMLYKASKYVQFSAAAVPPVRVHKGKY